MLKQVATPGRYEPPLQRHRRTKYRGLLDAGSIVKYSVEMTPVACDADLAFSQVTPASQGGVLPSSSRQLEFESALDFYTPSGAAGALRSLGLQLLESPTTEVSSEESHSVACELVFMEDDDLVTSADETVSMGSTGSKMSS